MAIPKWMIGGRGQREWYGVLDEIERRIESGEDIEGTMDIVYELCNRAFDEGVEEGLAEAAEKDKGIKIVYLTKRNADMIEGRGPMVNDLCFANRNEAEAYIDEQDGVMGHRERWSQRAFGDWTIDEVEVLDSYRDALAVKKESLKARALLKLTKEEKAALGLV